jgi:hypothetical protein
MFEKSELCQEILKIYDVVCLGLTKERGLTQFENFLKNPSEDDKQDLAARMKSSQNLLSQIISALKYERPDTFEHMIFVAAEKELEKCKSFSLMIDDAKTNDK